MDILKEKNILTRFKLLRKIKINPINNCDYLEFLSFVRGDHCYCSTGASKNLATPLPVTKLLSYVVKILTVAIPRVARRSL
jgi:hypothetical protein